MYTYIYILYYIVCIQHEFELKGLSILNLATSKITQLGIAAGMIREIRVALGRSQLEVNHTYM